jgi:hypothetical protein
LRAARHHERPSGAAGSGALSLVEQAFLLHAEGELTLEEIARVTSTNFETAKSRLRYARSKLRQLLVVAAESGNVELVDQLLHRPSLCSCSRARVIPQVRWPACL